MKPNLSHFSCRPRSSRPPILAEATVDYATSNLTALAGQDYVATNGTPEMANCPLSEPQQPRAQIFRDFPGDDS